MTRLITAMFALAIALPAGIAGQQPGADDPIGRHLIPPDLVMQHQRQIGLTAAQRETITTAIQEFQARIVELQWTMQDETQTLADLIRVDTVDEDAALGQIDRVLAVEQQIKRAHLGLLIRIKNMLDARQWEMLQRLGAESGQYRDNLFPGQAPGGRNR